MSSAHAAPARSERKSRHGRRHAARRLVAGFAVAPLLLASAGCHPEDGAPAADASALASARDASLAATADAAPADGGIPAGCTDPRSDWPAGSECLRAVTATIVDESARPLAGMLVSVCGSQCYYGMTDQAGATTVTVGAHLLPGDYSLLLHARPDHAGYYAPLPPLVDGIARFAAPLVAPTLPAGAPPVATDGSAQSLSSSDVTLDVPSGVKVGLSIEDVVDQTAAPAFRALAVDPEHAPPFVDPAAPPLALYALAPYEATLDRDPSTSGPPATLSFPNPTGLAPGTALEVLALGSLVWPDGPPAAHLAPIAEAEVSQDGSRIELSPGQGIDFITWVALRPKGP